MNLLLGRQPVDVPRRYITIATSQHLATAQYVHHCGFAVRSVLLNLFLSLIKQVGVGIPVDFEAMLVHSLRSYYLYFLVLN